MAPGELQRLGSFTYGSETNPFAVSIENNVDGDRDQIRPKTTEFVRIDSRTYQLQSSGSMTFMGNGQVQVQVQGQQQVQGPYTLTTRVARTGTGLGQELDSRLNFDGIEYLLNLTARPAADSTAAAAGGVNLSGSLNGKQLAGNLDPTKSTNEWKVDNSTQANYTSDTPKKATMSYNGEPTSDLPIQGLVLSSVAAMAPSSDEACIVASNHSGALSQVRAVARR